LPYPGATALKWLFPQEKSTFIDSASGPWIPETLEAITSNPALSVEDNAPVELNEVIPVPRLRAAVVVAHPDDEILWCGGYILAHPEFHWRVVTLCRASDTDRAPKFRRVSNNWGQR